MDARDRQARIEIILPDDEAAAPYVTDASVLRLARLIGRQMAREDYERQKRRRRPPPPSSRIWPKNVMATPTN